MKKPAAALEIDPQLAQAIRDGRVQGRQRVLAHRPIIVVHQGTVTIHPGALLKAQNSPLQGRLEHQWIAVRVDAQVPGDFQALAQQRHARVPDTRLHQRTLGKGRPAPCRGNSAKAFQGALQAKVERMRRGPCFQILANAAFRQRGLQEVDPLRLVARPGEVPLGIEPGRIDAPESQIARQLEETVGQQDIQIGIAGRGRFRLG